MSCHLGGSNQIGTMIGISAPGRTAGGGGYGCARCISSNASWSNADDPELATMRADITFPSRSMLKATRVTIRLRWARAWDGYRLFFSRILLISFCHAGNGFEPVVAQERVQTELQRTDRDSGT